MEDPREEILLKHLKKKNNETKCGILVRLAKYWFVNGKKIEAQQAKEMLLSKTMIVVTVLSIKRFLFYLMGVEDWQKAYEEMDEVKHLNTEFVIASQAYVSMCIIMTDFISILLGLLAIKFRKVARYIIFAQLVGTIAHNLVPLQVGTSIYPANKKLLFYQVYITSVCVPEVDIILSAVVDFFI